jgi:hypothetical protein
MVFFKNEEKKNKKIEELKKQLEKLEEKEVPKPSMVTPPEAFEKFNSQFLPNDAPYRVDNIIQQNIKKANLNKTLNWFESFKFKYLDSSCLLVNMELVNGDYVTFLVYPINNSFYRNEKRYVIDEDVKYYNKSFKMYALDYHENFTLPLKRSIPVEKLKNSTAGTSIEMAYNPSTLDTFIKSSVIEKVIKGADLDKVLDFIKLLMVIILIISGATLIIVMKGSGMFNNIKIPFLS